MSYGQFLYGALKYADEPSEEELEPYIPDLMNYLPHYYRKSNVINNIQKVNAKEIGYFKYATEDVLKQFFVPTATWGLALWEKELGLPIDPTKSDERRREIICAKLRGAGTTTSEMIKNVAIAFSGGEVEVLEYPNEYRFEIQFIGVKGIPPNMAGLIKTIENIKPAHLDYNFKYSYTWWDSLKALTWQQANAKTWNELRVYE